MDNKTFLLRIAYRNGNVDLISEVNSYGILQNKDVFYFEKDGLRTFIPIDVVMYFGRAKDQGY